MFVGILFWCSNYIYVSFFCHKIALNVDRKIHSCNVESSRTFCFGLILAFVVCAVRLHRVIEWEKLYIKLYEIENRVFKTHNPCWIHHRGSTDFKRLLHSLSSEFCLQRIDYTFHTTITHYHRKITVSILRTFIISKIVYLTLWPRCPCSVHVSEILCNERE